MGYDLYGFEKGVYSANIYTFKPLWGLVAYLCAFDEKQYNKGCFNDFDEFTKKETFHISQCLEIYLKNNEDYDLLKFYLFVKDSGGFVIT